MIAADDTVEATAARPLLQLNSDMLFKILTYLNYSYDGMNRVACTCTALQQVRANQALDQTRKLFFRALHPDQNDKDQQSWHNVMRRFQNVKKCRYEHAPLHGNSERVDRWIKYEYASAARREKRALVNVECLDVSALPYTGGTYSLNIVVGFLARVMSNLREINVSGTDGVFLEDVLQYCPQLEKLTMASPACVVTDLMLGRNLRELYVSGSSIVVYKVEFNEVDGDFDMQAREDCVRYRAPDTPDVILDNWCHQLERVDVKGASLFVRVCNIPVEWRWEDEERSDYHYCYPDITDARLGQVSAPRPGAALFPQRPDGGKYGHAASETARCYLFVKLLTSAARGREKGMKNVSSCATNDKVDLTTDIEN